MSVLTAFEKARESYEGYKEEEQREVTKLVTGAIRSERIILNPKIKEGRKNG